MGRSKLTRRGAVTTAINERTKINYTNTFSSRSERATLLTPRDGLTGSSNNSFVIFAGGSFLNASFTFVYSNAVDAFNNNLVRSNPTGLTNGKVVHKQESTSDGNFVLVAGGFSFPGVSTYYSTVDTYSSTLVKGTATNLSSIKGNLAGGNIGDRVIFGGGYGFANNVETYYATVDSYTSALVRQSLTNLSQARRGLNATEVSGHLLFGAGQLSNGTNVTTVDPYNSSFTRLTAINLSSAGHGNAVSSPNHALFGGGFSGTTPLATVDAFNASLTRTNPTNLSVARSGMATAKTNERGIFAGGNTSSTSSGGQQTTVDSYDSNLTRITETPLFYEKYSLAGATFNNDAFFAGGWSSNQAFSASRSAANNIDIYSFINNSLSRVSFNHLLVTPELSGFTINYDYNFSNIGQGSVTGGSVLRPSILTFTGYLEIPQEII
jgi:hypothetical protein